MHEASKAIHRRLRDPNFVNRYFRGEGVDIGSGNDPLVHYAEFFPLITGVRSWDRADGDAETMPGLDAGIFDFVHSSHCLEDLPNPHEAIRRWFDLVRPGGHMIILVPDEDMYEQGIFPSTFNPDHKWTFTIFKHRSWSPKSINIAELLESLPATADVIKVERLTGTYRFKHMDRQDQTRTPLAEAAIEIIVRKNHTDTTATKLSEQELYGRSPHMAGLEEQKRENAEKSAKLKNTRPAIALHRPGAIGDIIMTLALVPLLKGKYQGYDVHYFCNKEIGTGLARLMKAAGVDHAIDCGRFDACRADYALSFNLIGYPLAEGYPDEPMKLHLIQYFAKETGVDLAVGDGLALPYLFGLDPGPRPFGLPERYATLHATAGWSKYKNWPLDRWQEVIASRPDIPVFQIGSAEGPRVKGAEHAFMGKSIETSINLLAYANLHMGVDSFTNHLTNISWAGKGFTPSVILWGSTQAKAAGYDRNINLSAGLHCQPCFREDPKVSRQPRGPCINPGALQYDQPGYLHACMDIITVESVLEAVDLLWK
jgi:ADP-heptose:LPS heptosyltransferase